MTNPTVDDNVSSLGFLHIGVGGLDIDVGLA